MDAVHAHSADDWRSVLGPVVARYRDKAKRRFFRGDAAFALPDLWNCAAGAGQGSLDGDYASMDATVAPCWLPLGLDFGYSAVIKGGGWAFHMGNVGL